MRAAIESSGASSARLMRGTMMDFPLTIPALLERAGSLFARVEIVSRRPDRSLVRTNYGEFYRRARRLASALTKLGLQPGDRVASMMWNHAAHLETFFGVPSAGGILHCLNLRLHPHEIGAIAKHGGGRFLIIDDSLLAAYEQCREGVRFERVIVVPYCGGVAIPAGFLNYEELIADESDDFKYPKIDENDGAGMCYTSGTTGFSKGVIYSHRSQVLHSMALATADCFALSHHDVLLPVTPMFHANGWGLPYAGVMVGAKFVLAGPNVDAESLLELIGLERVTAAAGVPTIWLGVTSTFEKDPERWQFSWPIRILCGGTAAPVGLIRALDKCGMRLMHLWGMTETSPVGTGYTAKTHMRDWSEDAMYELRGKQGMPVPFVEMRVMRLVDSSDVATAKTVEAPRDGKTAGELEVRGPWIAASYYNAPEQAERWTADGWFRTGDVAHMDQEGYMQIVDRAKDLVKSGGEWISSVDLENKLMGHPAVKEAAVIGVPHPKWQERPLAAVVLKDGAKASQEELRAFLAQSFAKWQLPDAIVFLEEIPRTSVGKFKKTALRAQFANWSWDLR